MKKIAIMAVLFAVMAGCKIQNKEAEPAKPVIEYITGERGAFAVQDSTIILLPVDSALTQYDVRLYQGEEGLMLESPKILQNTLLGLRAKDYNIRIKETFTYIGKVGELYQYCFPYFQMDNTWGTYIMNELDYCWIVYMQEGRANEVDMIEFSPAEFGKYFDNVKAHYMN